MTKRVYISMIRVSMALQVIFCSQSITNLDFPVNSYCKLYICRETILQYFPSKPESGPAKVGAAAQFLITG